MSLNTTSERMSLKIISTCDIGGRLKVSAGTAVAQWLRCCATNRKVAGSIADGVIGIFHSDRTMALGLTHPLTEMSTRGISWG